ncbi:hypothetical protein ACFFRR_011703 [Megaselia abdita]
MVLDNLVVADDRSVVDYLFGSMDLNITNDRNMVYYWNMLHGSDVLNNWNVSDSLDVSNSLNVSYDWDALDGANIGNSSMTMSNNGVRIVSDTMSVMNGTRFMNKTSAGNSEDK